MCRSKGETEKAIDHFKTALEIASPFSWHDLLFWTYALLTELFIDNDRFDDAHTHIEHAESHAVNDAYNLGWVVQLQARFWYGQRRFEEARSAASHAVDVFEGLGAAEVAEDCRGLLQEIESTERGV